MDFAYLFSRVLAFYSMGYGEVMRLPISAFWAMSNNVSRISAERDLRSLDVGRASQANAEGITEARNRLIDEVGTVFVQPHKALMNLEPEEGAFDKLRALAG